MQSTRGSAYTVKLTTVVKNKIDNGTNKNANYTGLTGLILSWFYMCTFRIVAWIHTVTVHTFTDIFFMAGKPT